MRHRRHSPAPAAPSLPKRQARSPKCESCFSLLNPPEPVKQPASQQARRIAAQGQPPQDRIRVPPPRPVTARRSYDRKKLSILKREHKGSCRAGPQPALDIEPAAMALDDVLDDGEAKHGATDRAAAAGTRAVEALRDEGQVLGRDESARGSGREKVCQYA